ncbi:MAG: hypothetical protein ACRDPV_14100 [Gaiellaceae bacterium]
MNEDLRHGASLSHRLEVVSARAVREGHDRGFVRGAGNGALDAHGAGSLIVHLGQLAIVIGAIVAYWGNWAAVCTAIGFLVLSVAQLGFLGDTEKQGDWINGLHGFLALIVLIAGLFVRAARGARARAQAVERRCR